MGEIAKRVGALMASEISEAPGVFSRAVRADHAARLSLEGIRSIYTIARGSSDAVANILSYEAMRELRLPVTSLPPSIFSVYDGVAMADSAALVISQSGASPDLLASARGIRAQGGRVVAITNRPGSAVECLSDVTIGINAGPELAVPATKSVIGSVAAGMALIAALKPEYSAACRQAAAQMDRVVGKTLLQLDHLRNAILQVRNVYVIGRGAGYGAAHEIALKIKETCAIHAEAYSASEVLHGPLQLATKPLCVLVLDTCEDLANVSVDKAHKRFAELGADVHRISPADLGAEKTTPAAAAALLLYALYPVILSTAIAIGVDPDTPATLSKVTETT
jgi:glucosamine--fructose-6-phosphate aminotransferase (isomerizing)